MRTIPKCLRSIPNWFVTTPIDQPRSAGFGSYSAITLEPLAYHCASDYAFFDGALQAWKDHEHWFDGVGFHVANPWAVLVIQACLTPGGNLNSRIRPVMQRLHGYWEITRSGFDVQAFLWCPEGISQRAGVIAGHPAFVFTDGVCGVTGRKIAGCDGNPLTTDHDAVGAVLHDMATTPLLRVFTGPQRRNVAKVTARQLDLFP